MVDYGVTQGGTVTGNLAVTGNETVGGTLGVTGAATLASLGVTGNETVGGTLGVTGASTLTGTVSVGALINIGADVNLYRASADNLTTDDYFVMANGQSNGSFSMFGNAVNTLKVGTAGGGLAVAEGSNARMGVAVLIGGTKVVSNTSVTANTRIFLTSQVDGGVPGFLRVSARTAATSFTILSSNVADTSTVGYLLVEPA